MNRVKNRVALNSILLVLIATSISISSCGTSDNGLPKSSQNPGAQFVSTQAFSFNTSVDPATLIEDNVIATPVGPVAAVGIGDTNPSQKTSSYIIDNSGDLDSFNQTFSQNIALSDLDSYTYFFLFGPSCPDFFEYASKNYHNGVLTITLSQFTVPGGLCTASLSERLYFFKAHKL